MSRRTEPKSARRRRARAGAAIAAPALALAGLYATAPRATDAERAAPPAAPQITRSEPRPLASFDDPPPPPPPSSSPAQVRSAAARPETKPEAARAPARPAPRRSRPPPVRPGYRLSSQDIAALEAKAAPENPLPRALSRALRDARSSAKRPRRPASADRQARDLSAAPSSPPPARRLARAPGNAEQQGLVLRLTPGFGQRGAGGRMSLELTVRGGAGPGELTLALRHHPALRLRTAAPGPMTLAAHKTIAIERPEPGRSILRIHGPRGSLASGTLADLAFAVAPDAPPRSSVFVASAVALGQPGARVGTIGASMRVQ